MSTDTTSIYALRRIRTGKTKKDKASGAWAARFTNREKPIRQTSSHRGSGDNKGREFWGG